MTSNVFTKNDILQNLASRGYFIDIYTLDTFFAKKKIEAIFEDANGNEFFDKNTLNVVLEGLFNVDVNSLPEQQNIQTNTKIQENIEDNKADDAETISMLNNITLSDGTPLINKVQDIQNVQTGQNDSIQTNSDVQNPALQPIGENIPNQPDINNIQNDFSNKADTNIKDDIFAMQPQKDELFDLNQDDTSLPDMTSDIGNELDEVSNFDDITLLSESLEAQEKLRQYVVDELSKKNMDVTPKSNEFKLDISERTLNMIARTMAKKIAKYVGSIMAQDAKQSSKATEYQEENRRLAQKTRELEEQNRKLRLLLAESNKNLNSYKPSIFGLYKKVDPKTNK